MMKIMSTDLETLFDRLPGHELTFAAGDAVFHLGDEVKLVHCVRSGLVHLVRHQEQGATLILQRAAAGSILAEASVYSPQHHCDARAEMAATTWAVPRDVVRRRLGEDGRFSAAWSRHLAFEVQRARTQSEILALKRVASRLDAWIAWNGALPGKGQWARIAEEIGVSPEALYREIARRRG